MRLTNSDDKQITVCSRPFKEFRQLQGEILANLEDIEETRMAHIPQFPPTFTQSSFGVSLGEAKVVQRVRGLDGWVRAVAGYYPILSPRSQLFIQHFLNLDCLVGEEKYEGPIKEQLLAGNVFRGEAGEDVCSELCLATASTAGSEVTLGGTVEGGKYSAVRGVQDTADDKEREGWTVIGAKKQEDEAPKGCCVVS